MSDTLHFIPMYSHPGNLPKSSGGTNFRVERQAVIEVGLHSSRRPNHVLPLIAGQKVQSEKVHALPKT